MFTLLILYVLRHGYWSLVIKFSYFSHFSEPAQTTHNWYDAVTHVETEYEK